ncbi:MAG: TraR/DksA family transcriptional regulator [bacterium]|nr:TraR/DksA family transcriptional regulator [bacterium]
MAKAKKDDKKAGMKKAEKKKIKKSAVASKKSSGARKAARPKAAIKAKPKSPARPGLKSKPKPKPVKAKAFPVRAQAKKAKAKAAPAKSRPKPSPVKAGKFAAPELELGFRPPAGMLKMEKKGRQKIPPMDTIKKRFLKMKDDLLREVATRIESETDHRYEIGDIYDLATSERDREFSLLVGNRTRQRLQEIDAALDRINEKSYGVCEDCGQRISSGRILAMPFTRLCVKCKEEAEKKEEEESMLEHPEDEERVYEGLEEADDLEDE